VLQSSSDDDVYQTHDKKSVVFIPHTHSRHFISCSVLGDTLTERQSLQDILKSKMPADIGISLFEMRMLVFIFLVIPCKCPTGVHQISWEKRKIIKICRCHSVMLVAVDISRIRSPSTPPFTGPYSGNARSLWHYPT
jgi:hypothetical protein